MVAAALEWGSVSDWISGLATAVAVVVALVFSLRTERQQRDAALAAVHAWFELRPGPVGGPPRGTLRLVNNTDYPVYDWSVDVSWGAEGDREGVQVATGQAHHGLLPPGSHEFGLSAEGVPLPANDADVQVELRFKDALGHRRRRLPTGRLVTAGR